MVGETEDLLLSFCDSNVAQDFYEMDRVWSTLPKVSHYTEISSENSLSEAFISYSRTDGDFVSTLENELSGAGFHEWRDVHGLRAGDRWPRKLGDAIAASPRFILVWSAEAAASDFVELEWTIAIAVKRKICIVTLDSGELPATLRPYQTKVTADAREAAWWLVDSLGSSLHQVGYCYSSMGNFAEARPWFQRAVEEAEKGDVHGRVDHASLGSSLHQVGYCYSRMGSFAEARPWFERAVEEAEKGDVWAGRP